MPASAHWSEVVDARNPGNVPRRVRYVTERFKPLDPASAKALKLLRRKLADHEATEADIATMFGAGYQSLDDLSAWAVSWALDELALAWTHPDLDEDLKAHIARHYRRAYPTLARSPDV
jgi:hypothetical protein